MSATTRNRIRNKYVRWRVLFERFGYKVREARLSWFGHVQRNDCQRMLKMEMPGRSKRGRPERRFVDEGGQRVGVMWEDAKDRVRWRQMMC